MNSIGGIMKHRNFKLALLLLVALVGVAYATTQAPVTSFEISPNPMEQFTTVTLSLSQKVVLSVTVENSAGTVIKTLYTGDLNMGTYQLNWDRYSDLGLYVPAG